ncbi:DUF2203 domain-containing protein [Flindersiella endophytica]
MALFTVDEARDELARLLPVLHEVVRLRADAAELGASLGTEGGSGGVPTSLGGLPEFKAMQARLDELLTQVQETGAELKGLAPLLVATRRSRNMCSPSELEGVPVLLCWLEGDSALEWYHRTDLGFAGRRRLR